MDARHIKEQAIRMTPPRDLVRQLLEKSVLFMQQADAAIERKDYDTANRCLIDAQNIFSAFSAMFRDRDAMSFFSKKVMQHIMKQLLLANVNQDRALLAQTIEQVNQLVISYKSRLTPL